MLCVFVYEWLLDNGHCGNIGSSSNLIGYCDDDDFKIRLHVTVEPMQSSRNTEIIDFWSIKLRK